MVFDRISRAEFSNAFCFKAPALDFNLPSNQQDAKALLAAFLSNEDNKKNLSLDYYKRIGSTVTCYQSKANNSEAYVIVSPRSLVSRAFKIDSKTGAATEIYGDEAPIARLAKLADEMNDFKERGISGTLQSTADRLADEERISFPAPGTQLLETERRALGDLEFLRRYGSLQLAQLVENAWVARDAGQNTASIKRAIGLEIIKIARAKEKELPGEIARIEAGYIIEKQ
jgi:hypothetical protein